MTHPKNYEYVKKWRENNRELNLLRGIKYSTHDYHSPRILPTLISSTLFFIL